MVRHALLPQLPFADFINGMSKYDMPTFRAPSGPIGVITLP